MKLNFGNLRITPQFWHLSRNNILRQKPLEEEHYLLCDSSSSVRKEFCLCHYLELKWWKTTWYRPWVYYVYSSKKSFSCLDPRGWKLILSDDWGAKNSKSILISKFSENWRTYVILVVLAEVGGGRWEAFVVVGVNINIKIIKNETWNSK